MTINDSSLYSNHLSIQNLSISFPDFQIQDINIELKKGEMLVLLGHSGSGKTTLIQIILGILQPEAGDIQINGESILRKPIHQRSVGIVFQDLALFPHLTVFDNIAYGLKITKLKKTQIHGKVNYLLDLVELSGFGKRKIQTLSGGEKQRVALARTLAPGPEIILFDEPLSALDESLRLKIREQIKKIQQELKFTAIYVTHDQEEAFFLADKMAIMSEGKILQIDTPENIYLRPNSRITAEFLGFTNFLSGRILEYDHKKIAIMEQEKLVINNADCFIAGEEVMLIIKSEAGMLSTTKREFNSLPITIVKYQFLTGKVLLELDYRGNTLKAIVPRVQWTSEWIGQTLFYNLPHQGISAIKIIIDKTNR